MKRRSFITGALSLGIATHPFVTAWRRPAAGFFKNNAWKLTGPAKPVFIYNNWSAYDELSDNVPQTEELSMRELAEIVRFKQNGVQIDYYVMDAFWFEKSGGYRTWHKQHWPNGPDKWLTTCKANNIKPGMWFSTNMLIAGSWRFLEIIPEWKDSESSDPKFMCLFEGGYTRHLADSLQIWYDKGIRLYKFDFANFGAATPDAQKNFSPAEIVEKNKVAFMDMLQQFRKKNPDVLIIGYNGFGGDMGNTYTVFDKKIDPRWMDVFDALYCGDPRFSDVPMMNIWRSGDNYSDHQVNAFKAYGLPMRRIDNSGFMIGKTGTCYSRANQCWKGMLILELARGGWINCYYGNLEVLDNADTRWFAKSQRMYQHLQQQDNCSTFGAIPGTGKPYGFKSSTLNGAVCTVVNPSQEIITMGLPVGTVSKSKVLYSDGGFVPLIKGNYLILGPEQLTVVGFGEYASDQYRLGVDETIQIPLTIRKMDASFKKTGKNIIEGSVIAVKDNGVRILLQQFDPNGLPHRSFRGGLPAVKKISEVIMIKISQDEKEIPMHIEYDKMIWSGLSWAAGEIRHGTFDADAPLNIRCISEESEELKLSALVYAVTYEPAL